MGCILFRQRGAAGASTSMVLGRTPPHDSRRLGREAGGSGGEACAVLVWGGALRAIAPRGVLLRGVGRWGLSDLASCKTLAQSFAELK